MFGVRKEEKQMEETIYKWTTPDGYGPNMSAAADTPIGRIKVNKRRPTVNKYVAWVKGEVIGRDYINMDTAKRAAEHKVTKLLEAQKKAAAES
jgi:hypothetical protein